MATEDTGVQTGAPDDGAAEAGGAAGEGATVVAGGAGAAVGADAESTGELPPLDFGTFIVSLSSSVLMNLGVVENPVTGEKEEDHPVAMQTIELISLLKEKTKGNLTGEEEKLVDDVLYELRLWYCKIAG